MTKTALDIVLLGRFVGGLVGIRGSCDTPDASAIYEAENKGWVEWWGMVGPDRCWSVTQEGWDALEVATC